MAHIVLIFSLILPHTNQQIVILQPLCIVAELLAQTTRIPYNEKFWWGEILTDADSSNIWWKTFWWIVTILHHTPVNAKQFDGLNIDGLAGKRQKHVKILRYMVLLLSTSTYTHLVLLLQAAAKVLQCLTNKAILQNSGNYEIYIKWN